MSRHSKAWICEACTFVFQTYGHNAQRARRVFFCPNCGENHSVVMYRKEERKKPKVRELRKWSDEELAVAQRVLSGELQMYQAAMQLGRTLKSVRRRVDRMKGPAQK